MSGSRVPVGGCEAFTCTTIWVWRRRGQSIDVETCEVYETGGDFVVTSWVYGDLLGQLVRQIDTATENGGVP